MGNAVVLRVRDDGPRLLEKCSGCAMSRTPVWYAACGCWTKTPVKNDVADVPDLVLSFSPSLHPLLHFLSSQVTVTANNPTPKEVVDAAVFGFVLDEEVRGFFSCGIFAAARNHPVPKINE